MNTIMDSSMYAHYTTDGYLMHTPTGPQPVRKPLPGEDYAVWPEDSQEEQYQIGDTS